MFKTSVAIVNSIMTVLITIAIAVISQAKSYSEISTGIIQMMKKLFKKKHIGNDELTVKQSAKFLQFQSDIVELFAVHINIDRFCCLIAQHRTVLKVAMLPDGMYEILGEKKKLIYEFFFFLVYK